MRAERILVLQLKRIGDLVLTAPAIDSLRATRPGAEIVLVVPKACQGLAGCLTGVGQVLAWAPGSLNLGLWRNLMAGAWDVCLDFTGNDRSSLMALASRARLRVGYAKFCGGKWRARAFHRLSGASVRDLHTVDFHRALVAEALGEVVAADPPYLQVPDGTGALLAGKGVAGAYAVVHPGTARIEKFWTTEGWLAVMDHLRVQGLQVLVTGSNEGLERPQLEELRARAGGQFVDLSGQLSLTDMVVLLRGAAVAVGVDSMAMHLAAMFGRPQVVLFGPTNPFHWRPLHPLGIVVNADGVVDPGGMQPKSRRLEMKEISTAAVLGAMDGLRPQSGW